MISSNSRSARLSCSIISATGLLIAAPAIVQADSTRFDIAAQPLPAALKVFARQARMQLLYEHRAVAGATANAVVGELDKQAALDQLLSNTGLEAIYSSQSAAAIRPVREPAHQQAMQDRKSIAKARAFDPMRVGQASQRADAVTEKEPIEPEEVIVTAQRRSERLFDVPLSVSVHSGAELAQSGVASTREFGLITPGVIIPNTGAFTAPTIRGISSDGAGPGLENNVAFYVDGVYQPSQSVAVFDLPDVTSVQILKGPQGTLYGRNATGGAILFTTADPTFAPTGRAFVSYGSYDDWEAKLALSGPLMADKLAGSIAGYHHSSAGYVQDLVRGGKAGALDSELIRAKLLAAPSDNLTLKLTGYYSRRDDETAFADSLPGGSTAGRLVDANAVIGVEPYTTAQDFPSTVLITSKGATFEAVLDSSYGTLTALSGWTRLEALYLADADFSSAAVAHYEVEHFQRTFSQDLTFVSRKFGPISLLGGLFYVEDDGKFDPLTVRNVIDVYSRVTTQAGSAFLEVNYEVTNRLSLVGGLRYSYEKKELFGNFDDRQFPKRAEDSWDGLTPRASVRYELSDSFNAYFTYSEGFRGGGFNETALQTRSVDQEEVIAYEIGLKSATSLALAFDAAVFLQDYENIQVQSVQVGTKHLLNAAKARIYGLDLNGTFSTGEHLSLRAGLSYLHTQYLSFPNAALITPNENCPVGLASCGNVTAELDASGNHLQRAPEWSAFLSATYLVPLRAGMVSLTGTASYNSGFFWDAGNFFKQDAYRVINAQVSWVPRDGKFRISVWGKNLTDQLYGQAHGIGNPAYAISWATPRTGGVSIEYSF